ncbi:hypothetical protein IWZ01DRAFT_39281 [Phyllosticta capitalensis]
MKTLRDACVCPAGGPNDASEWVRHSQPYRRHAAIAYFLQASYIHIDDARKKQPRFIVPPSCPAYAMSSVISQRDVVRRIAACAVPRGSSGSSRRPPLVIAYAHHECQSSSAHLTIFLVICRSSAVGYLDDQWKLKRLYLLICMWLRKSLRPFVEAVFFDGALAVIGMWCRATALVRKAMCHCMYRDYSLQMDIEVSLSRGSQCPKVDKRTRAHAYFFLHANRQLNHPNRLTA